MKTTYFNNPILGDNVADPTIWRYGNTFYLYYTGPFTCPLYSSTNMVDWKKLDKGPFSTATIEQLNAIADKYESEKCIYAPTVVYNTSTHKYQMYISLTWKCMCVLQSESPDGPFEFVGEPYVLIDNDITNLDITNEDSCVARDFDGTLYLMWGSHGNLYRTTLTDDGLHLSDGAKFNHVAGAHWWRNGRNIYEGLYTYWHDGYWYLFAAKGNYTSAKDPYEVVVGRSKTLGGVFRNKLGLRMDLGFYSTILVPDSTEKYLGGGHTGEIFQDKQGNYFIYYQRQLADVKHYRPLFLQQIFWDDKGWPYFKNGKTTLIDVKPIV